MRMECAVFAELAHDQSLGVVLESVRWRFGSFVTYAHLLALIGLGVYFYQKEVRVAADFADRARHNVSAHAQMLGVDGSVHGVQLFDGYVVALALLHPGPCEIAERQHNHRHGGAKLGVLALGLRHSNSQISAAATAGQEARAIGGIVTFVLEGAFHASQRSLFSSPASLTSVSR